MSTTPSKDPERTAAQLFAMLTSVSEFDEIEVRGVMKMLITPTDRENCFLGIYHRAVANVASLKALNNRQHFQAISSITRNLFELAVDIKAVDLIPDSIPKMIAFAEVEKLRCARKIVNFKATHPAARLNGSAYASFIGTHGARIDTNRATLWPGITRVAHWSGTKLSKRIELLGEPFEEIYEFDYPRLSWYVHAGLTGIAGVKAHSFTYLCGVAINTSVVCYEQILLAMIREFGISKADSNIENKLYAAKLAPFADNQEEANRLFRELMR